MKKMSSLVNTRSHHHRLYGVWGGNSEKGVTFNPGQKNEENTLSDAERKQMLGDHDPFDGYKKDKKNVK